MKKAEVLALVLLVVILLLFFRSKSLADPVSPGPSPGPGPVPAGLLVGAILSKQPSETCATKYGANWAEVTQTLCAKTS